VEKFRKQAPVFLGFAAEDVERADLDAGHQGAGGKPLSFQ